MNQIKARAYEHSLSAGKSHNFPLALPEHLAEQAAEMLKSSYNLDSESREKYLRASASSAVKHSEAPARLEAKGTADPKSQPQMSQMGADKNGKAI